MKQIGRMNTLSLKRIVEHGAYLDGGELGDILLAKKDIPNQAHLGDLVEAFVFSDKEGRLRATTQKPLALVGMFARLRVLSNSPSGAYLDWGLQKDLLVPKREQREAMEVGRSYVVYVFLEEKSNRIAASTKLDKFLSSQAPEYEDGEEADLLICEKTDLGYKAIVDNSHWGMLYHNEVFQKLQIGAQVKGYIHRVREDLKIDLLLQAPGYQKVDGISEDILRKIADFGGVIPVSDKSQPEDIYSVFGISKKNFKKAIGNLYKKRLIIIDDRGIRLAKKGDRAKSARK